MFGHFAEEVYFGGEAFSGGICFDEGDLDIAKVSNIDFVLFHGCFKGLLVDFVRVRVHEGIDVQIILLIPENIYCW